MLTPRKIIENIRIMASWTDLECHHEPLITDKGMAVNVFKNDQTGQIFKITVEELVDTLKKEVKDASFINPLFKDILSKWTATPKNKPRWQHDN